MNRITTKRGMHIACKRWSTKEYERESKLESLEAERLKVETREVERLKLERQKGWKQRGRKVETREVERLEVEKQKGWKQRGRKVGIRKPERQVYKRQTFGSRKAVKTVSEDSGSEE